MTNSSTRQKQVVWGLGAFLLALALAGTLGVKAQPSIPGIHLSSLKTQDAPTPLEVGKSVQRDLKGDEHHVYQISLEAGQFLHVIVNQKGVDVALDWLNPEKKPLVHLNFFRRSIGPESLYWVAETTGTYFLKIQPEEKEASLGHYTVQIEQVRSEVPQDSSLIFGQKEFAEAEYLRSQKTRQTLQRALEKYDSALIHWRNCGNQSVEALVLHYQATVLANLGELQKSLDSHEKALVLQQHIKDLYGEATSLNDCGVVSFQLGKSKQAIDLFQKALLKWQQLGDYTEEASTLNNLGFVSSSQGDHQTALNFYTQVLKSDRAQGTQSNEAITLNNIGIEYYYLGEFQQALDYFNPSLQLRRALADKPGEANTLNNVASIYLTLGDYQQAQTIYTQVLLLDQLTGDRYGEAITLDHLGQMNRVLGNPAEGLEFFNKALLLKRTLGSLRGEAQTLHKMGVLLDDLHQPQQALEHYLQALEKIRKVGEPNFEAIILTDLGLLYLNLNEEQKALDSLRQALQLEKTVANKSGEAKALYALAQVEAHRGNLQVAQKQIESAIQMIESIRTKVQRKELQTTYFATTQKYYEFYIDLLMKLHTQNSTAGWDALALQVSEQSRARGLLELLIEMNARIRQGVDPQLVEQERHLQHLLNAKAERLTKLLNGKSTQEQKDEAEHEITQLTTELQDVQTQIRQKNPRYAALTQPQPLSAKEIQERVLDRDTLLLEYSLGQDRSYLWVVTPTSIKSFELPKQADIEALAKQVYEAVTTSSQARRNLTKSSNQTSSGRKMNSEQKYGEAASQLSQMILGPAAQELDGKRLLVVPDGVLQYVPFSALPMPKQIKIEKFRMKNEETKTHSHFSLLTSHFGLPLIVKYEVITLPSASSLAVLRQEIAGRQPAPKLVAVLADPVFSNDDERLKSSLKPIKTSDSSNLLETRSLALKAVKQSAQDVGVSGETLSIPRLPGTRTEAQKITSLVPSTERKQALDFSASRETVLNPELSQYRIIHFATHGFANSQHPELSGLVLSLVNKNGEPQDGYLRAHELYNLNLPAELVVLSACETGLGKEIKGEGLVGLTRGFMYAGAARVVVSLWGVSDRATAELMGQFYRGMLQGKLRPSAALRQAQLELWKQARWSSPYYWAAFQIQGEWK